MSSADDSSRDFLTMSDKPILLEKRVAEWKIVKSWTLDDWCAQIGPSSILPFRCGENAHTEEPQWESTCTEKKLTMQQFLEHAYSTDSPEKWLYFDYKHLHDWFQDKEGFLKEINWSEVGFPDRKSDESTLWIGSKGAHTPCHADTYGFNLVAQIYGQKQWILFPPDSGSMLQATRVPYEESSIYSEINFFSPPKDLQLPGARVVTLNPGDVLLVPNGWWHYVETVSPIAISLNTWVQLPNDKFKQLEESVVKLMVSSICRFNEDGPNQILNPNECDIRDDKDILNYVKWATQICETNNEEPPEKKQRQADTSQGDQTLPTGASKLEIYTEEQIQELLASKRKSLIGSAAKAGSSVEGNSEYPVFSKRLINAICSPEVLSVIRKKILQE